MVCLESISTAGSSGGVDSCRSLETVEYTLSGSTSFCLGALVDRPQRPQLAGSVRPRCSARPRSRSRPERFSSSCIVSSRSATPAKPFTVRGVRQAPVKYIGNAILQLERTSDLEKYKGVVQENARQSLKQLGREDFFDKVEYFFNQQQGDFWTCGWKVELP